MTIVMAFDKARLVGEKWEAAISKAARIARKRYPSLRASNTEVRRVLSQWRPRDAEEVLVFKKGIVSGGDLNLPAGDVTFGSSPEVTIDAPEEMLGLSASQGFRTITAFTGQKPHVPRTNAAAKPRKRGR